MWDKQTGYRTRSIMCVPMKNHHGGTLGVIQVLNKRDGYFTVEDESLLSALASQAAVCVENSKLFLSVVGKNMELLETKDQLADRVVRQVGVINSLIRETLARGETSLWARKVSTRA